MRKLLCVLSIAIIAAQIGLVPAKPDAAADAKAAKDAEAKVAAGAKDAATKVGAAVTAPTPADPAAAPAVPQAPQSPQPPHPPKQPKAPNFIQSALEVGEKIVDAPFKFCEGLFSGW